LLLFKLEKRERGFTTREGSAADREEEDAAREFDSNCSGESVRGQMLERTDGCPAEDSESEFGESTKISLDASELVGAIGTTEGMAGTGDCMAGPLVVGQV
jgi:hypothetical protein